MDSHIPCLVRSVTYVNLFGIVFRFGGFAVGLNPRTWIPKTSTLPLDQRSRYLGDENATFSVWQDVGIEQLGYRFLNGIRNSLFNIYSFCLIVFMKISSAMNSETSDWSDAPFTVLCVSYKERTKSYESKYRGVLLTYYRPALNSRNSCKCQYPLSDGIRMREAIL